MFGEDHDLLRQQVRAFIEREIAPHAAEWERARDFPNDVFRRMGALGFIGPHFPTDVGGGGGDFWHACVVAEELSRCRSAGVAMALMVQGDLATPVIGELGTPEQKEEFLRPALQGERIAALAVTEPDVGSDVASIRTTAQRVGDEFVVRGQKAFVTNGARADFLTLAVKTDPDAAHGGLSVILFPTDVPGFAIGRTLEKIGNHASDTAELFFDDCRVPARYVLGEQGRGLSYVLQNFQGERLVAAVFALSCAQLALDETVAYCRDRLAFGRPILDYQVWRHRFVDLATAIEAGRRLAYHAVDLYARKVPCVREVTMAKLFGTQVATRVADECLQAHGAWGYVEAFDVSRFWRDSRLLTIGGGTTEILREILARML